MLLIICNSIKSADVWTRWFIKWTENGWLLLSINFTAKYEMLLVLTKKNFYSYKEYNKLLSNRKRLVSLYAVPGILKMEDWHIFMCQTLKILNVFVLYLSNFFKKLEYRFLVENTLMITQNLHENCPVKSRR